MAGVWGTVGMSSTVEGAEERRGIGTWDERVLLVGLWRIVWISTLLCVVLRLARVADGV